MTLFRYFGSHAYETLEEGLLMTSRVSGFNDPFEFLYVPERHLPTDQADSFIQKRLADPSFQALIEARFPNENPDERRKKVTEPHVAQALCAQFGEAMESTLMNRDGVADMTIRLVCFSSEEASTHDEILLWSHYANKHKGYRIGFDFPKTATNGYTIESVSYDDKRVPVRFTGDTSDPQLHASLSKSVTTKSIAWKYENEARLMISPFQCEPKEIKEHKGRIERFFRFESSLIVKVDCGLRSSDTEDAKIVSLVKERYSRAVVRKAQFHKANYSLEYHSLYEPRF